MAKEELSETLWTMVKEDFVATQKTSAPMSARLRTSPPGKSILESTSATRPPPAKMGMILTLTPMARAIPPVAAAARAARAALVSRATLVW